MLYIRADGNANIGMGHVMRCLSVAEAASEKGQELIFLTADEGCRDMIEERGFCVAVLGTDYKDMMSELPLLENQLNKAKDILLVDSYQVSVEYYRALRNLVRVACFEDMGTAYPVNLLINYNLYGPQLAGCYQAQKQEDKGIDRYPDNVLLGVEYMPLRKAFQVPSPYQVKDKVTDVIITTGGSDPYFAAAALTDAFLEDDFLAEQKLQCHLISGPFNSFADALKSKYGTYENVTIHENVKDMRGLLLRSDVVVSATGSTIYEVSSLGVPMIAFYFAENQRQGAEALEQLTDIVNAGCFAENADAVTGRAVKALQKCIRQKAYRELLHEQEKRLVDGKGALRIAEQLIRLAGGNRCL
ncbi:MAG: UDP-2,4-diacetamido-2,4,6-trideoxy-beta-L-altropyranose hydrolase [Lachnospiraceae bacterium]|nr:UDP-2,4-diacetamido-2,4,6-trideoxy-beta-L-altropyranose hydrolase [Lachnospiraceae bacterium]